MILRKMGAEMSTSELEGQLADQLLQLVEKLGTRIKGDTAQGTIKVISELSPWFSLTGNLNIEDWEQVRADLCVAQRERGTKAVPLAIYSLWRLIRDALLSEDVLVKEQLEVLNKTLEEIQRVESVSSIRSFEDQEVKSIDNLDEEEEILEGEIALLTKQLEKEEGGATSRDAPIRHPPQRAFSATPLQSSQIIYLLNGKLKNLCGLSNGPLVRKNYWLLRPWSRNSWRRGV